MLPPSHTHTHTSLISFKYSQDYQTTLSFPDPKRIHRCHPAPRHTSATPRHTSATPQTYISPLRHNISHPLWPSRHTSVARQQITQLTPLLHSLWTGEGGGRVRRGQGREGRLCPALVDGRRKERRRGRKRWRMGGKAVCTVLSWLMGRGRDGRTGREEDRRREGKGGH